MPDQQADSPAHKAEIPKHNVLLITLRTSQCPKVPLELNNFEAIGRFRSLVPRVLSLKSGKIYLKAL